MWKTGIDFKTAFDLAKSKRQVVNPNVGFMSQLINWGKGLHKSQSLPKHAQHYTMVKHDLELMVSSFSMFITLYHF
jgi:hypothetical protein